MHEWARQCLVMAAKGASLDELRDFCNENGIPARCKEFWSQSTWNSLLQPAVLMKYCGHEVWNVHRKNGTERPPEEWLIVEKAHPALITEEEALAIRSTRGAGMKKRLDRHNRHRKQSRYLLSGGLFKCGRCGANMVGLKRSDGTYYVCGSSPNRRGLGCGPGVYVARDFIEAEVLAGLRDVWKSCVGSQGTVRQVNEELRTLWDQPNARDMDAGRQLVALDTKLNNIRRAIEEGLADVAWANDRLEELAQERERLRTAPVHVGNPPQIDAQTALAYRREAETILAQGDPTEKKRILRAWVEEIRLAPESLSVQTTYRIPEPIAHCLVAGAGFEPATFGL